MYDPPIDEFSVLLTVLKEGESEQFEGIEGPSILIFTELDEGKGQAALSWSSEKSQTVEREGQVFFVAAGERVAVEAKKGRVVAYRAFVEA